MRSQNIENIRKKFHNEWLLIKLDANKTTGKLIAHSPNRDEVFRRMMQFKKSKVSLAVEYSEKDFPEGVVAAFPIHV